MLKACLRHGGLGVDDPVWDHSTFSKNRDRLLDADVAAKFMATVLAHKKVRGLLSNEHFPVDGTLAEAWASTKSVRTRDKRTTRHAGYKVSQRIRKRIEEPFGWAKVNAGLARTKFRGRARVEHHFTLAMAACNLIRLPRLLGASP